ncbi:mechanosensitive ion channel family protein [Corynebacterium sp. MC-04]|uniref:Mechanosensitive ion channel family protein n=1 Tax=Corynebacterium parakroppenstedtii TaxID=2828363 RepID=A0ABS9HIR9_9CORY|nr:mechanosensitive ion channel family protein [Corynebacterium parakroppenstedtii]KXB51210.1 transporter, small conductance mechanosensitive ion channel MscS family protein [Corynebacterium kroppenstedtii]MBY0792046.1 mechanosensitive ion channel family protein [Corynebacterium parakroppenstedtii]MBY0796198.1 mechanosensitive ion channel family protein [Corynebacterium parakroppenstedtii]MCF6768994.1 mechanosensitive ion channel family protein [Corynebacterium parakroppenstedtii]MCF6771146.1 
MPFKFYLTSMWEWVANTGLSLAILICIAILIPRIGRLVVRWATIKMNEHEERRGEIADTEGYKGRLAILGALVYIAEAIAFFFVAIRILKDFGFSTTGAAVPATVVSAAVAFGAQKIIADFLAGFFIITERQYGVGDWVILQNKDAPVEGTVTAITLRSTTVRTINGQEAVVPNSVPLVAVNASSGWAKAQIDIPVPLTAGDNTEDLNALFDGCVNRTLAKPEIARLVSDDADAVSILPALDLIPPTSAGVPWSIQYRVLIRVEPGQQWTVERALRSAVMDEMWASYSRSTIESLPGLTRSSGDSYHAHGDGHGDEHHGERSGDGAHASTTSGTDKATTGDNTQALDTTRRWAATLQHEEDEFEGRPTSSDVQGPASSETASGVGPNVGANGSGTASDSETVVFPSASGSGSGSTSGSTAETRVFSAEDDTTAAERAAQASDHGVNPTDRGTSSADASDATTSKKAEDTRTSLEKEAEDAQQNGLFRRISYERRIQRLFSIGGRCRASTSAIVLVLIILVILQGLTYDGGDRGSGILAPSSFQSRSDKKESDDKSESSAPTTPESNTHSENPTTEQDSNSENGSNTPTTTPNRTQPTTTTTNTENNRNQQNSTNGNQNSGNNGNTGSNSDEDNSGTGGANQQDTDSSNQGSGSGNSNSGNDNSGQMNLSHGQGDNNTASTMAP